MSKFSERLKAELQIAEDVVQGRLDRESVEAKRRDQEEQSRKRAQVGLEGVVSRLKGKVIKPKIMEVCRELSGTPIETPNGWVLRWATQGSGEAQLSVQVVGIPGESDEARFTVEGVIQSEPIEKPFFKSFTLDAIEDEDAESWLDEHIAICAAKLREEAPQVVYKPRSVGLE